MNRSICSFLRLDDDGERFPTPGSATRANRPGQATPWRTARIWCWPAHPSNAQQEASTRKFPQPVRASRHRRPSRAHRLFRSSDIERSCAPCVIPISDEETRCSTAFADDVISTHEGSRHAVSERRFRVMINSNRRCPVSQTAKLFMGGRSQAVRLPAAFRFHATEVFLRAAFTFFANFTFFTALVCPG